MMAGGVAWIDKFEKPNYRSALRTISQRFLDFSVAASRQQELRTELEAAAPTVSVPFLPAELTDLDALGAISEALSVD